MNGGVRPTTLKELGYEQITKIWFIDWFGKGNFRAGGFNWGVGLASTSVEAQAQAIAKCGRGNCEIIRWDCSN